MVANVEFVFCAHHHQMNGIDGKMWLKQPKYSMWSTVFWLSYRRFTKNKINKLFDCAPKQPTRNKKKICTNVWRSRRTAKKSWMRECWAVTSLVSGGKRKRKTCKNCFFAKVWLVCCLFFLFNSLYFTLMLVPVVWGIKWNHTSFSVCTIEALNDLFFLWNHTHQHTHTCTKLNNGNKNPEIFANTYAHMQSRTFLHTVVSSVRPKQ